MSMRLSLCVCLVEAMLSGAGCGKAIWGWLMIGGGVLYGVSFYNRSHCYHLLFMALWGSIIFIQIAVSTSTTTSAWKQREILALLSSFVFLIWKRILPSQPPISQRSDFAVWSLFSSSLSLSFAPWSFLDDPSLLFLPSSSSHPLFLCFFYTSKVYCIHTNIHYYNTHRSPAFRSPISSMCEIFFFSQFASSLMHNVVFVCYRNYMQLTTLPCSREMTCISRSWEICGKIRENWKWTHTSGNRKKGAKEMKQRIHAYTHTPKLWVCFFFLLVFYFKQIYLFRSLHIDYVCVYLCVVT